MIHLSKSTYQKVFSENLRSIPEKNQRKFAVDLLKLIDLAHKDNYENFEITEN